MDTKVCTKCIQEQPLENFRFRNKKKGIRTCWCKSCFSIHERTKWADSSSQRKQNHRAQAYLRELRNRKFVWAYLHEHSCVTCGEGDPIVLEFDHIDKKTKTRNISDFIRSSWSIKRIQQEMAKCQVMCGNCHRRKTAKEHGWDKSVI